MKYYSTKQPECAVDFRTAVMNGLAADGGLYMPERIPRMPDSFPHQLMMMDFREIAYRIAEPFCSPDVPSDRLGGIIEDAFPFAAPLKELEPGRAVLELFHGPTLAFKDFGARFMARVMAFFAAGLDRELTVLVATSGDTGSAVGSGFQGVDGIRVLLLYPSGKVSRIQEQQLTTMGGNVTALEIDGTFDDCQRLVKRAFMDQAVNRRLNLTSANSINIARLIPQSFYYFEAFKQAGDPVSPVVFAVPSGNLGNLTAGLFAFRMGLPVRAFIAAVNANDVFREYIETGVFSSRPAVPTCSNAMDVGNPSNLARIRDLYRDDSAALRRDIRSAAFSDEDTVNMIGREYRRSGYVFDPHGAVGSLALDHFQRCGGMNGGIGIVLATAHPAKFLTTVEKATGGMVPVPERLARCLVRPKQAVKLGGGYADFREYLYSRSDSA